MRRRDGDRRRRRAAIIGIAVLAGWTTSAAAGEVDVHYGARGLTVRIEGVPIDDVLTAVARETGLVILGEPLDRRDVSKRFDEVPLDRALRRIVGRQNFVLRYGPDGAPTVLELLGPPQPVPRQARSRGSDALRLLLAHAPVPVPPHAAAALGGTRLGIPRLLVGLRHADAAVRAEVAETVVRTIESDPNLLGSVRALDSNQLVRFIANHSSRHSAENAALLYRAARDPGLKAKLSSVIAAVSRTAG